MRRGGQRRPDGEAGGARGGGGVVFKRGGRKERESATRDETRRGDGLPLIICSASARSMGLRSVPWFLRVWLACPRSRDASWPPGRSGLCLPLPLPLPLPVGQPQRLGNRRHAHSAEAEAGSGEGRAPSGLPGGGAPCVCAPDALAGSRLHGRAGAGAPGSGRGSKGYYYYSSRLATSYFCFLYLCPSQISNLRAPKWLAIHVFGVYVNFATTAVF